MANMGPRAFREFRRQNLAEQDRLETQAMRDLQNSPVFSSGKFTWDNSGLVTVATAEVSELVHGTGTARFPRWELGKKIRIQSKKTGATAWFTLLSIATDDEGDLLYWEFKGETQGRKITVMVFND